MDPRRELPRESAQPVWPKGDQRLSRGEGIVAQPRHVHPVAGGRKGRQQADAMIELDRGTVKVSVFQQMMHAHTNLEDALVQVTDLPRRRPPEQLECLVLFEELTCIELVDGLQQGWRCGLRAQAPKVGGFKPLKGTRQFRVG